jgi:hypothetical protein
VANFEEMEPELETLIAIKKPAWLIGKEFLVLFEGRPVWTLLTQLNLDGTFQGIGNAGIPYPGRIKQEELMIGIGTRLQDDPVLQALQEYMLKLHLFAVAVPGFENASGSVHWEINPKMAAGAFKASYLLDIYQESDPHVAHLYSAVYLYATRLNYVSPDLEWLANAYVAEMKMKIESRADSTTWTPKTRASLEAEMRHAFFDSKAKADTLLKKGVIRPLFDPDKIRSVHFPFFLKKPGMGNPNEGVS